VKVEMKMKKIIYGACAAVCLLGFMSCGEDSKSSAPSANVSPAPVSAEESEEDGDGAWFMAQTKRAPVRSVSATSELVEAKFAGKYLYPPINILDGNFRNTWCEAVDGDGIGEAVTVEFSEPVSFDEIQVVNGFATKESWAINNRIKTLQITQVAGEHFQRKSYELKDGIKNWQSIKFELPQTAQTIEFKIMDVYRGTKYRDTCLDDVRLLYKGRVIPFTGIDELKEIQEENSKAMLNSDFEVKFRELFKPSANKAEKRKYIVLKAPDGSGLVLEATVDGTYLNLEAMYPADFDDTSLSFDDLVDKYGIGGRRQEYDSSEFDYLAIAHTHGAIGDYEVGNCRIMFTSSVSYVNTNIVKLIKIDGDIVNINGVRYTVIPSGSTYIAKTYY